MAHDYVYGSSIKQGVIMVCTPDLYYQEFKVEGPELRRFKHAFLKRLDMYHDLIHDEKEQYDSKKEDEEYLKELQKKL
jgi:genome maintenance exonuclease 1